MRKLIAILAAVAVMAGLVACGANRAAKTEESTSEISAPEVPYLNINSEPFVITGADGLETGGLTAYICSATEKYQFEAQGEKTEWSIYVFDEKNDKSVSDFLQNETPMLKGDGILDIEEGQYIYIFCGSALNDVDPAEVKLSVTYANAPEFPYLVINSEPVVVTAKSAFEEAGVTAYICSETAEYQFDADDDDDTVWKVYVLEEKFEDANRYLSQAQTPVLIGDGVIEIKEGNYIYIECSSNAFTADAPSEAEYEINYAAPLSGNYGDSVSQRAGATVIEEDDEVEITVYWSSSAAETTHWEMECKKEGDRLTYTDCEKSDITFSEDGSETAKVIYEDGEGYFTVKDGKLYWDGAAEEDCKTCIFEK